LIRARLEFGPTLKARRERQGVTLQAIADSTKINVSLLAALERNDLARWPRGIFRRAYFRDYVVAIGLPPEPLVAEFIRLFPDEPSVEPVDADAPVPLTLELEIDPRAHVRTAWLRGAAAIGEVSAVVVLGAVAAWVFGADLWMASGVIGLIYYPIANTCVERRLRIRFLSSLIASRPFRSPRASSSRQERGDGDIASAPELEAVSN